MKISCGLKIVHKPIENQYADSLIELRHKIIGPLNCGNQTGA